MWEGCSDRNAPPGLAGMSHSGCTGCPTRVVQGVPLGKEGMSLSGDAGSPFRAEGDAYSGKEEMAIIKRMF